MSAKRWQKVKGLFDAVVELDPKKRKAFLNQACGADDDLRRDVEKLLASSDEAESFMEQPAVGEVASLILERPESLVIGQQFSHYEIIKPLGAGGMGEVYLAQDTRLERKVALKILPAVFAQDAERMRRFVQEAKAASALNHPNILTIYEAGETENTNYIVSEYVKGQTLRERLRREPLSLKAALDVATQITSALQAAHGAGIVHRDIKPENVMIRPDGLAKLLDFGIAKLIEKKTEPIDTEAATAIKAHTKTGTLIGTAAYMSPEQARSKQVDARTDIFSFGVVLYEMLAGKLPFEGENAIDIISSILQKAPVPLCRLMPDAPHEIERIVGKALRKDCEERYQTAKDFLIDLKDLRETLAFDERLKKSHSPDSENAAAILQTATGNARNRTDETNPGFARQIKQHKALAVSVLMALLVCSIGLGYYFLSGKESALDAVGKKSIAVLPFVNASQDANAEYLSDGITESIINNLSQLAGLRVMSRNSAFRFKNNQGDTKNIASQLGVGSLVTGDIKQIGDQLVINVRLINGNDDSQIWGNQYVKTSGDIIATQNEIAQKVVHNLRLKLSNSEQQQLDRNNTENAKAYELYLRGRYFYYKITESDFRKSIGFYHQAIDIDPNYALAYAGIADDYRSLALNSFVPSKEVMPQAKAAAQKALEIDENLAEAHIILGWIGFLYDWDWSAAENELKRAIELAPNNSDAHFAYAHLLSNSGRQTEAIVEGKRARELDPLSLVINAIEGHYLFFAGRDGEAITSLKKTLELEPNFWLTHAVFVRVYMRQERYPEAIAEARKAKELSGGSVYTVTVLGYALAKSGNRQQAQATLTELKSLAADNYVPAYSFATICIGLGEREEALKYLEKSFQERETLLSFIKIDPQWEELRSDLRFRDLLRRVGLRS